MIKKYIKQIFILTRQLIIDIYEMMHLKRRFPQFRDINKITTENYQKLKPYYEEYITTISNDKMAISLELSAFLMTICELFKPKSILDLGSGFSSFAFRLYITNLIQKPTIWSVDDSQEWLEKTRMFLDKHNIYSGNLTSWSSFMEQNHNKFDMILHDLGTMEVREKTINDVLMLSNPNGMIILDDIHKYNFHMHTKHILAKSNFRSYSLTFFTKDKFGRYSMLATNDKALSDQN
jgi:predicted O-methyltransferase YrrM